jgi:hypothetical protein
LPTTAYSGGDPTGDCGTARRLSGDACKEPAPLGGSALSGNRDADFRLRSKQARALGSRHSFGVEFPRPMAGGAGELLGRLVFDPPTVTAFPTAM